MDAPDTGDPAKTEKGRKTMNKTTCFAKRNLLEMTRDPLSYIFCVAFPLVMLVIMTLVNDSIPNKEQSIFNIDNLAGGVIVFGQTFIMLFTALGISMDRSGSFLTRLFASPMKSRNFILGYVLPMLVIAEIQIILTMIASLIISVITGHSLSILSLPLAMITCLPSALMFISIGLIFGTLFNEKSAPGLCSVIISLGSFVGGIWFDAERTGGVLYDISKCTPFLYCTRVARCTMKLEFPTDRFFFSLLIVIGSTVVLLLLAVSLFKRKMRADLS